MRLHNSWLCLLISLSFVVAAPYDALAVRPAAQLLPTTTQGYLTTDDVERVEANFAKTQIGQLSEDPVMKPFTEDFKKQLRKKWGKVFDRLGLTIDDLRGVPSGETTLALIKPGEKKAALALLADVTGHEQLAKELLGKINKNMLKEKAKKVTQKAHGVTLTVYTLPKDKEHSTERTAAFFLHDNMLVGVDHLKEAEGIVGRLVTKSENTLASDEAYLAVMARAKKSAGDLEPDLRWFIHPIDFFETMRYVDPDRKRKKGKDMLKILASQGFRAVQGIGGNVNLYLEGKYEIVHRTAVYAPPVKGVDPKEKYTLAARMLRFPNGGNLTPQPWVPRGLATYLSFNLETREVFEYSSTLVDALVGEEGVFEDVIESIRDDPNGPKIDLRADLVSHLGQRATMLSDYALPITTKSERIVMAINTTNSPALAETIKKTMESDENAVVRKFEGHTIYEIVEEEDDLPTLRVETPNFDPLGGDDEDQEEEEKGLPSSAVCVAYGHLFVATHIEFLKRVLVEHSKREMLANSADYNMVMDNLEKITDSDRSFRYFTRTDEEFRATYELIRAGKMPESETMLGKMLNSLFTDGDDDKVRAQKIDGHSLPDFEMVRRYFGPAGISVTSEPNGWFLLGITLNKDSQ